MSDSLSAQSPTGSFDRDTSVVIGLIVFALSLVVAPIVTAMLIRLGYRQELKGLMHSSQSPSIPTPSETPPGIGLRLREPDLSQSLVPILGNVKPLVRFLLYIAVFGIVTQVLMPSVAPSLGLERSQPGFSSNQRSTISLLALAVVLLVIVFPRVSMGYSGLGLYSFMVGSMSCIFACALLVVLSMSIYQWYTGLISFWALLGWLLLGLPFAVVVLMWSLSFGLFVCRLMLLVHVAVDRLPVGPGFKACSFACMSTGFSFAPSELDPRFGWLSGIIAWLKFGLALSTPLVLFVSLSLIGLFVWRRFSSKPEGLIVLYLRTFASRARSVRFLRRFGSRWRVGSSVRYRGVSVCRTNVAARIRLPL